MSILEVKDLKVSFRQDGKTNMAVKGVSFTVDRGETVALVGESGSGNLSRRCLRCHCWGMRRRFRGLSPTTGGK